MEETYVENINYLHFVVIQNLTNQDLSNILVKSEDKKIIIFTYTRHGRYYFEVYRDSRNKKLQFVYCCTPQHENININVKFCEYEKDLSALDHHLDSIVVPKLLFSYPNIIHAIQSNKFNNIGNQLFFGYDNMRKFFLSCFSLPNTHKNLEF